MRGLIYKITCLPTGRSYIGKTRSTQQQRWYQHCSDAKRGSDKDLHKAIREYGSDVFQVTTLQEWEDISNEALQAAETDFIREHGTFHNGYNMQVKGQSPYTPVPIEQGAQVSERLESEVKRLMAASLSQNTQRAYQRALEGLEQHLEGRRLTDGELAAYITHLHDSGKSPSTISQLVASASQVGKTEFPSTVLRRAAMTCGRLPQRTCEALLSTAAQVLLLIHNQQRLR